MSLTDKASAILSLATLGKTDKQIAQELGLQPSAVDWHWRRIRRVLHASNRAEAVAKGLKLIFERERQPLEAQLHEAKETINRLTTDLQAQTELTGHLQKVLEEERETRRAELRQAYDKVLALQSSALGGEMADLGLARNRAIAYVYDGEPPYRCHQISRSIEMLGYDRNAFLSGQKTIFDIIYPEDLFALGPAWEEVLKSDAECVSLQYRYVAANGNIYWTFARASRLESGKSTFHKLAMILSQPVAQIPSGEKAFIVADGNYEFAWF